VALERYAPYARPRLSRASNSLIDTCCAVQQQLREPESVKPNTTTLDEQRIASFIRAGLKATRILNCLSPPAQQAQAQAQQQAQHQTPLPCVYQVTSTACLCERERETDYCDSPTVSTFERIAYVHSQSLVSLGNALNSLCNRVFAAPEEICSTRSFSLQAIAVLMANTDRYH
jgi:hypothetical protein